MQLSDAQTVALLSGAVAALGVGARAVYELARAIQRDRRGPASSEDMPTRMVAAVTAVLERHSQRQERLLEQLMAIERETVVALDKQDFQLGAILESIRALAERVERRGDEIRALSDRVNWRLAKVG